LPSTRRRLLAGVVLRVDYYIVKVKEAEMYTAATVIGHLRTSSSFLATFEVPRTHRIVYSV
jgi:hypothetical protein